jgi:hypothetical protein
MTLALREEKNDEVAVLYCGLGICLDFGGEKKRIKEERKTTSILFN